MPEIPSATRLAEAVGARLGAAQGRAVTASEQVLDAWLDAQQQAVALLASEPPADAEALSLASPELPAEIAQVLFHSLRAGFCSLAIACVIADETSVEPWLTHALIERLVSSAKEHLRLLASVPGVAVDEAIVPPQTRLDLRAVDARHREARAASKRALDDARARLGL